MIYIGDVSEVCAVNDQGAYDALIFTLDEVGAYAHVVEGICIGGQFGPIGAVNAMLRPVFGKTDFKVSSFEDGRGSIGQFNPEFRGQTGSRGPWDVPG
jgi:hypothetical protein